MRAVDKAYNAVRDGILAGRFAPASRITEQEIALAAGVSRTPVREALRRLHAEGLVDFTPNQGAVVTEWSTEDADEIFHLRAMLESYGAERAAVRATAAQIGELRALAEQQHDESLHRRPGYLERIGDLNNRFHRRLQEAAGSGRLSRALAALLEAPLVMKTFLNYSADDLQRSAAHHLELVRALEARDGEWAASVMRSHVLAARRTLKHSRTGEAS
ncbi:MAG: GntR family transcriptional regulator [Steroidobacteraceae bacterium]|jgi:DNA-binding GntR family transcriptional regulator|nr:GntR family transcriptional regulator [Steroidobacteraceae bacterium]